MKVLDRIATGLLVFCISLQIILLIVVLVDRWFYKPHVNDNDYVENVTITSNNTEEQIEVDTVFYTITEEERYLLAKLAHSEASICSVECQQAVVSVVFNRLESGRWKKDMNGDGVITLYDIIYYPNAFTPAMTGAIDRYEPTKKDYAAVDYVLSNGPTLPTEVRYFRTNHDFSWDGYLNYKTIDNVYFGYFEDWEKGVW